MSVNIGQVIIHLEMEWTNWSTGGEKGYETNMMIANDDGKFTILQNVHYGSSCEFV